MWSNQVLQDDSKASSHRHAILWFGLVGIVAALVHYTIAVSLVTLQILSPAFANIGGFACAFPVSFWGHRHFSFSAQVLQNNTKNNNQVSTSFWRFLLVALAGFGGNHLMVLAMLRFTDLPFWIILGVVMLVIASSTYLLSRFWAFKA